MRNKVYPSADAAVADIRPEARIFFGGFGGAGFPNNLIQALDRQGADGLTVITNNCGSADGELGILFKHDRIRNVIASFPGPHASHFQQRYAEGKIRLELVPQGILCERMRAAGAGIYGFYSAVGAGTLVAEGREERTFAGRRTVFYEPLAAPYALIKAWKADELGNLVYRKTARNFNPLMAVAAETTIVEVDEIVPVGALDAESIVTPFVFVHRIVKVKGIHNVVRA
ncbi:MAG TPA: 3-oxoacid CoA-transferase subunit A [Candidatus Acidoferrales bacterium]|nr:3-oxoacid CoA-transferase subunit A [Candidatus Acidoferrales bacterium]